MKNKASITKLAWPCLCALLAVLLIWIGVIAIGVFWACVFDGEQLLLRNLLLFPFTMIGIYATLEVWQLYRFYYKQFNID